MDEVRDKLGRESGEVKAYGRYAAAVMGFLVKALEVFCERRIERFDRVVDQDR